MKKYFILFFIFSCLIFCADYKGKSIKVGIHIPSKNAIHFGTITFGDSWINFSGKARVKDFDRDGVVQKMEMFFDLPYNAIDAVSTAGSYENFMKIFINSKSEFAADNQDLIKNDMKGGAFVMVELYMNEQLKPSWEIAKAFKASIEGESLGSTETDNKLKTGSQIPQSSLGRLKGEVQGYYFNSFKIFLGIPTGDAEKGKIKFYDDEIVFSARVDDPKSFKKTDYLKSSIFSFSIPLSVVVSTNIETPGEAYLYVTIDEGSPYFKNNTNIMTKQKKIKNEIVFRFDKSSSYQVEYLLKEK
jgi:hypothetical protein